MPSTVDADALANWDGFVGAGHLAGPFFLFPKTVVHFQEER
ncbi:hypothetical protein ACVR05_08350 [Streptococcus caprae]